MRPLLIVLSIGSICLAADQRQPVSYGDFRKSAVGSAVPNPVRDRFLLYHTRRGLALAKKFSERATEEDFKSIEAGLRAEKEPTHALLCCYLLAAGLSEEGLAVVRRYMEY